MGLLFVLLVPLGVLLWVLFLEWDGKHAKGLVVLVSALWFLWTLGLVSRDSEKDNCQAQGGPAAVIS